MRPRRARGFGVNSVGQPTSLTVRALSRLRLDCRCLGVPDVVVYDASIYQAKAALELSDEALRLALDVHVVGALNTAHARSRRCSGPTMGWSCSR